jgi:hypothetical protein
MPVWGSQAASADPGAPRADSLSSTRLRDLGFEADQMAGSIDFAKGQHFRHF